MAESKGSELILLSSKASGVVARCVFFLLLHLSHDWVGSHPPVASLPSFNIIFQGILRSPTECKAVWTNECVKHRRWVQLLVFRRGRR